MNDKDKAPATLESIIAAVKSYQPEADESRIERAYLVASEGHAKQVRASGEPYIIHPLSVAEILTELHLDDVTICAAIMHDVVEDTLFKLEEIRDMFGEEMALLIDGVTKISLLTIQSDAENKILSKKKGEMERARLKEEQQLETYRKMIIAMAKDIRVIMIKLADRLHNMRTLKYMRPDKQKRIAKETLEIYAPIANRLGISSIKWELEDLSLRYLEPEVYYELVYTVRENLRKFIDADSIDCVIVPGVAFDLHCNRLGLGGGYYDKFLPRAVAAKKIALAYDFQIVEDLPVDNHDSPVDLIITENRIIRAEVD